MESGLQPQKPSLLRQVLTTGLPFLVTAGFIYWIFRYQIDDPGQIWRQMKSANLWILLAIIPVSTLSHLLRAWRWNRFIGQPVSLFYSFTSIMIGYAVNDVLPRVGEIARIVNMNRTTGAHPARLLASLVAERILDVLALVLLLGISLMVEGPRIGERFPELARVGPVALLFSLGGLVGLIAIAFASPFLIRITGALAGKVSPALAKRAESVIRNGAEGLAFLKRPSQALPVLLETTGIWVLYFVCFLMGLAAFGLVTEIGLRGGLVAFSVSVTGVLVPAVGAIGPYHQFGKLALTDFYGVNPNLAFACITVLHFLLFYVVGGLGGVLAWVVQGFVRGRGGAGRLQP
jgi:uncharacterized protein (TIRG00374 family)